MRRLPPVPAVLAAVVAAAISAALAAGGCAGSGGGGGGGGGGSDAIVSDPGVRNAQPVTGNCQVTLRTWNRNPDAPSTAPTTVALVNASSEKGRMLLTGKATSSSVRPLEDDEMGRLLAVLDAKGFASHAKPGVTLESVSDDTRVRGVLVIDRDGVSRGITYYAGAADAGVFRDCKNLVFSTHNAVGGFEVRAATGDAADPNRTFQAPPIKMRR